MEPTTKPNRRAKWIAYLLVVPLLLLGAYTWFSLTWSYAQGERAGYVQKLSKRGWLCKTWEGELALVTMPGTVAEKFLFTVRHEDVATRINNSMGQRVSLEYRQHVGVPSTCFGDTQYFVDNVRLVQEPTLAPSSTAAPAAAPPPAAATPAPGTEAPAAAPAK